MHETVAVLSAALLVVILWFTWSLLFESLIEGAAWFWDQLSSSGTRPLTRAVLVVLAIVLPVAGVAVALLVTGLADAILG